MSAPAPSPSAAPSSAPDSTGAAPRSALLAWVLFAPLALLGGLRWVLNWQQERAPAAPAWAISPFAGTQDPWAWLHTLGWVLAALALLAVLGWAVQRRWGTAVLARGLGGLWLLLCLLGCAAQIAVFLNLRPPQPLQPVRAEVLGTHQKAPSARAAGGTLLVLRLQGHDTLQQVLLGDPAAAQLQPHQWLQLELVQGRWRGRYVTAWQPVPPSKEESGP